MLLTAENQTLFEILVTRLSMNEGLRKMIVNI